MPKMRMADLETLVVVLVLVLVLGMEGVMASVMEMMAT